MKENILEYVGKTPLVRLSNIINRPSVVYSPEYGSKLTDNLSFEHNSATVRMMYYGDYYDTGKAHWHRFV